MKHAAYRALALLLLPLAVVAIIAGTPKAEAQSAIQSYALLSNASTSGPLTFPAAGNYQLAINGTFGGATLTLTEVQTQGGASVTLGTYTSAPFGVPCFSIPAGVTLQMTIAGGSPSGINAILGGVGSGGCALSLNTSSGAPGPFTQVGYQQITSLAASAALTVPTGATFALIVPETQAVRWRPDGSTTAPTASVGVPLAVGATLIYAGDLAAIRFIEQSASAKLDIVYGK